jgi:hypothetical protein
MQLIFFWNKFIHLAITYEIGAFIIGYRSPGTAAARLKGCGGSATARMYTIWFDFFAQ